VAIVTIWQSIAAFLKSNRQQAFCDACIQRKLGLKGIDQAQQVTKLLAFVPGFGRIEGPCFNCSETRKTTVAT